MSAIRKNLESLEEYRGTFTGEFKRFGGKGGKKYTILLLNVADEEGKILTDHIWLNVGKRIKDLGHLHVGDRIRFDGRVKKYRKGSVKRGIPVQYDYKFTYPSKVHLVE